MSVICPTSAWDMITLPEYQDIPIPTFLEECGDEICNIVKTVGNHELAGIGAFVSRIIQVGVSFFCGFFPSLFYLITTNGGKKRLEDTMPSIQHAFIDTSTAFGIAVGIASIYYQAKNPLQLYEILTLQLVSLLLLFSQLSTYVTISMFSDQQSEFHVFKRTILTFLCVLLELFNSLSFVEVIKRQDSQINWPLAEKLISSCGHVEIPTFHPLPRDPVIGVFVGVFIAICLIFLFPMHRKLKLQVVDHVGKALAILLSLAFTVGAAYLTIVLGRLRASMKNLVGADFEDNKWDFAQVIAVFLWIPVGLDLLVLGLLAPVYRWMKGGPTKNRPQYGTPLPGPPYY